MELITQNLLIRSFQASDTAAYASIVADPAVMRYLGEPQNPEDAARYVTDCLQRDRDSGVSRYAVLQKSDGAFLGFCGFKALTEDLGNQVSPGNPWIDFGWRYRQSSWGNGYGMEAARAVYAFGKDQLGLTNIEARAHVDNIGSLRIIENLGFEWLNDYQSPVGTFRRFRESV